MYKKNEIDVFDYAKANSNIVELANHYGYKEDRNGKISCFMHEDKTPSMKLYPDSGTFNCFGSCKGNGTVIDMVMAIEGVEPIEACRRLSEIFNFELPDNREKKREKSQTVKIFNFLTIYYHRRLLENKKVIKMIKDKWGLELSDIKKFKLGYADGSSTYKILIKNGFSKKDIWETGMHNKKEIKGVEKITERYWNHIMTPYLKGVKKEDTLYFAGRIAKYKLSNKDVKYLYLKHRKEINVPLLWGRLSPYSKRDTLILCEGNFDAYAGAKITKGIDVAALLSTTLSAASKRELYSSIKTYKRVLIIFDAEEGKTIKPQIKVAIEIMLDTGIVPEIGFLKNGEKSKVDIADYNTEGKTLELAIKHSKDSLKLMMKGVEREKNISEKIRKIEKISSILNNIDDEYKEEYYNVLKKSML